MSDNNETNKIKPSEFPYLHGFDKAEQDRLRAQARFAEQTVYKDVNLSRVKELIEIGSGVGAQTEILLRRFPDMHITCVDRSEHQLASAKEFLGNTLNGAFKDRFELHQMDATNLTFDSRKFDGAFLCWILEHVPEPAKVLSEARRVLRPGGRIYITEVMNSSFLLDPYSPNTWKYWQAFNDYQYDMGGDPFIGAKLGNLLMQQGFRNIKVESKTWHLDNRRPDKRKEFIDYWCELLLSAAPQLVKEGRVEQETVDEMRVELRKVSNDPNAVFYYSFVQASANAN
ncbi:class I SAM-dependent methyltransferase [Halobacteriovorax sp. HFRX-2_2]|uniref:class I SAM-dependent methyltransferase n=1 Tax=unclassified Halobacteriovorax TaxID=2639665 RepID=UPI0037224412